MQQHTWKHKQHTQAFVEYETDETGNVLMHLHNAIEALNHDYELIFLCILLDKKAISVFFCY